MLTIEDCLEKLNDHLWYLEDTTWSTAAPAPKEITSQWDRRFIGDVHTHISNQKSLSTAQGDIAIKLIDRYRSLLEAKFSSTDIDALLVHPQYRRAPYVSTHVPREVRWVGDNRLAFRFKYNPGVREDIKKLKATSSLNYAGSPQYVKSHQLWLVEVDDGNLEATMTTIRRHNFKFDDEVALFLTEASNASRQHSSAALQDGVIRIQVLDDPLLQTWLEELEWLN